MGAWKRDRKGYGWWSADGAVFLERGAPMSCGGTAWRIWFAAEPDEYDVDEWGAYAKGGTGTGVGGTPLRQPADLGDGPADPDVWFLHLYDAGSLAEAKYAAGLVLAERAARRVSV